MQTAWKTLLFCVLWINLLPLQLPAQFTQTLKPVKRFWVDRTTLSNRKNYQVTFGYWNDNYILDDVLKHLFKPGPDDYVTASFWLQTALEDHGNWWLLDSYYNILTFQTGNYRADLLSFRISKEENLPWGSLQVGTGIITRGNFGGSDIQNSYHRLFGYEENHLPYLIKNETGILFFLKAEPVLFSISNNELKGYLANSLRTAAGPSNFRLGIDQVFQHRFFQRKILAQLQLRAGVIRYYLEDAQVSPLFKQGYTWGILISMGYIKHFGGSLWLTRNQYGLHQPHIGISVTLGWNGNRLSDLSEITFP